MCQPITLPESLCCPERLTPGAQAAGGRGAGSEHPHGHSCRLHLKRNQYLCKLSTERQILDYLKPSHKNQTKQKQGSQSPRQGGEQSGPEHRPGHAGSSHVLSFLPERCARASCVLVTHVGTAELICFSEAERVNFRRSPETQKSQITFQLCLVPFHIILEFQPTEAECIRSFTTFHLQRPLRRSRLCERPPRLHGLAL